LGIGIVGLNPNKAEMFFSGVSLFYFSILVEVLTRADPRPMSVTEYGVLKPIIKLLKAGNDYVVSAFYRDWKLHSE
jgi:hypothetical protein